MGLGTEYPEENPDKLNAQLEHSIATITRLQSQLSASQNALALVTKERDEAPANAFGVLLTVLLEDECTCGMDEHSNWQKCPKCTCRDWVIANGGERVIKELSEEEVKGDCIAWECACGRNGVDYPRDERMVPPNAQSTFLHGCEYCDPSGQDSQEFYDKNGKLIP